MKQQPVVGFLFALITAIAWGTLPIALKQVLANMNTQTIVWYRFITASVVLFIILWHKNKLPTTAKLGYYWYCRLGRQLLLIQ